MERLAEEKLPLEYPPKVAIKIYLNRLLLVLAAFLLVVLISVVLGIATAFPLIGLFIFLLVLLFFITYIVSKKSESYLRFIEQVLDNSIALIGSPIYRKVRIKESNISEEVAAFLEKDPRYIEELVRQISRRKDYTDELLKGVDIIPRDTAERLKQVLLNTEKKSMRNKKIRMGNPIVSRRFSELFDYSENKIYMSKDFSPEQKMIIINEIDDLRRKLIGLSILELPYNVSQTDEVQ